MTNYEADGFLTDKCLNMGYYARKTQNRHFLVAARLKPDQAHIHYQLGRAYIAAGRKAEGESQLEISRELKEKARTKTDQ